MEAVAGAPKGHTADEAGETPQTADGTQPESGQQPPAGEQIPQAPGFGERGRMRRRARFLRKARELAYRDLGGLVFDLHRFGQRNDPLVLAKLATLRQVDSELRELEAALSERRPVTVLREVGIAACPRCAAIHGSDDRFCPSCGLAFDARADRPIATAPVNHRRRPAAAAVSATPATTPAGDAAPASPPAPAPTSRPAPQPVRTSATPTATPVRAPESTKQDEPRPQPAKEDEPTQIIRPTPTDR